MVMIVIVAGVIIVPLVLLAVYSVAIQRRAVDTQSIAASQTLPAQQEALGLAREGMLLSRESMALQRDNNRLLTVIAQAMERR